MHKLLLALVLLASYSAEAAVYKCTMNGKTIYTDSPCHRTSATAQIVDIVDNKTGSGQAQSTVIKNPQKNTVTPSQKAEIDYMSDYDIKLRIKELESSMKGMTATYEKIHASQNELAIITSKRPQKLSYENETRRSGLRKDLGSIQRNIRSRAWRELEDIYRYY